MYINHVALWVQNLETMRDFYCTWFNAGAGDKYHNPKTGFESYFLSFATGARMELMRKTSPENVSSFGGASGSSDSSSVSSHKVGYAHAAFSAGSPEAVNAMVTRFKEAGYTVVDGPRITGDGYYEAVILDPEGNRVEITV